MDCVSCEVGNWSKGELEAMYRKQENKWPFVKCCIHELLLTDSVCQEVQGVVD